MIALVLAPAVIGVAVGYLLGGRLGALVRGRVRAVWLLLLAAAVQLTAARLTDVRPDFRVWTGLPLTILLSALVAAWLAINLVRRGRTLRVAALTLLAGWLMNGAVIVVNGAMPYSSAAVRAVQPTSDQLRRGAESSRYVAAGPHTRLPWLGDVIPVPPIRKVLSAGDVALLIGAAALIAAAMTDRPDGTRPRIQPSTVR